MLPARLPAFLCLVAMATAMPEIPDAITANNGSQFLTIAQQINDTRFLTNDGNGPYTLLIPVDDAFVKLGQAELNNLQSTPGQLNEVLGVHVLNGQHFSWDLRDGRVLGSSNGHMVRVFNKNGVMYFNDARVLKSDVMANGAVLIFIDKVLDAPEGTVYGVLRKPEFGLTTIADLVDQVRYNVTLDRGVGPYTMFAPSEDAFARLGDVLINQLKSNAAMLRHVVEYHIHSGTLHLSSLDRNGTLSTLYRGHTIDVKVLDDIKLNGVAMLEEADIDCDNGVIHIIDHVLLPSTLGSIIG